MKTKEQQAAYMNAIVLSRLINNTMFGEKLTHIKPQYRKWFAEAGMKVVREGGRWRVIREDSRVMSKK